jgi:iron complex outermembrane receptor protein
MLFMFVAGQVVADSISSTFDLSLEELMEVEITSAARKPQQLKMISAAVHIISAEDIRRSGATNIPEALRLAPGVQVLAFSNNRWSVSIRGSAREYVNKLLVLVDGRSVYSPTFSGLMWEALDIPLENILRIEVIRGPGASIWGSNAVNGVINIITRPAGETLGSHITAISGSKLESSLLFRHGYKENDDLSVRYHIHGFDRESSKQISGERGEDAWSNRSVGFRIDKIPADCRKKFMMQGNVFRSRADDEAEMFLRPPAVEDVLYTQKMEGLNLAARWEDHPSDSKESSFQASIEKMRLEHILIDEDRTTVDLDYTERFAFRERHDIVWGGGVRFSSDSIDGSRYLRIRDKSRFSSLLRFFVNDEITLSPDRLQLILGGALEHNQYTGYEFQPSIRALFTPDQKNTFWTAFSRAARIPSRLERGADLYYLADPVLNVVGDIALTDIDSEKLQSFDFGWRRKVDDDLAFDLAGFYFKYLNAVGSHETAFTPDPAGYMVINRILDNRVDADYRGAEMTVDWKPAKKWQLNGIYSYLDINLALPTGVSPLDVNENVPARIYQLMSHVELDKNLRWSVWFKHTGRIDLYDIPAYDLVDTSLCWKINERLRLTVAGQNIFDREHQQTVPAFLYSKTREFGRHFYLKADWEF